MFLLHVQQHQQRMAARNRKQWPAGLGGQEPLRKLNLLGRQLVRSVAGHLRPSTGAQAGSSSSTGSSPSSTRAASLRRPPTSGHRHQRPHLSRHSMACCLQLKSPDERRRTTNEDDDDGSLEAAPEVAAGPASEPALPLLLQEKSPRPAAASKEAAAESDTESQQPSLASQLRWSWRGPLATSSGKQQPTSGGDKMGRLIGLLDAEHARRSQGSPSEPWLGGLQLEESWRSFVELPAVDGGEDQQDEERLTRLSLQQEAIWELLTTEASYLGRLRVLIQLFQATLLHLQQHALLTEVEPGLVFGNLGQVFEANSLLWSQHLEPMLQRARLERRPLEPRMMSNAFVQIRSNLGPAYSRYCLDHAHCLRYLKHQNRSNELFKVYLAWCEGQKECERLRLSDLLAKPMQRLTKYPLLLGAVAKRTDDPEQLESLEQMVSHATRFVRSVDLELRRRDELERLESLANRIELYETGSESLLGGLPEAAELLRRHAHFRLEAPLLECAHLCRRQVLLDSSSGWARQALGSVRFRDGLVSGRGWLEVVLVVLTDQLLVCRPVAESTTTGSNVWSRAKSSSHSLLAPPSTSNAAAAAAADERPQGRGREPAAHLSLSPRAHSLNLAPLASPEAPPAPAGSAASLGCPSEDAEATSTTTAAAAAAGRHHSSSSLAAARELFRLSAAAATGDEWPQAGGLGRLRCIRAPIPLDRLLVHALQRQPPAPSLLCCQLNDSLTPAASFLLQPTGAAVDTCPSRAAPAGSRSDSEGPQQQQQQQILASSAAAAAPRRSQSLRRASQSQQPEKEPPPSSLACRRLAGLLRQAQARLLLASLFHERPLAPFLAELLPASVAREAQRLARLPLADPLEPPPPPPPAMQAAGSPTNPNEPDHAQLGRALLEQLQLMRLAHYQQQRSSPAAAAGRRQLAPRLFSRGQPPPSVAEQRHIWLAGARHAPASPTASQLSTSSDSDQLQWAAMGVSPQSTGSWSARSSPTANRRCWLLQVAQPAGLATPNGQPSSAGSLAQADDHDDCSSASLAPPPPAAAGRRPSPRRAHLSSLRRQNVILSASGEQQTLGAPLGGELAFSRQGCHSLVSLAAPSTGTTERRILARLHRRTHTGSRSGESQATTMDQLTSAVFDCDSNDLFELDQQQHQQQVARPPGGSFDRHLRPQQLGNFGGGGQQQLEARSASVETRPPPPISVTLTRPDNSLDNSLGGQSIEEEPVAAQQLQPQPPFHLCLTTQRPKLGDLLSPIHSVSVASPSAEPADWQTSSSPQPPPPPPPRPGSSSSSPSASLAPPTQTTAAATGSSSSRGSPILSRLRRLFRRLDSRTWRPAEPPAASLSTSTTVPAERRWGSSSFELAEPSSASSPTPTASQQQQTRLGHWLHQVAARRSSSSSSSRRRRRSLVMRSHQTTRSEPVSATGSRELADEEAGDAACYRAGLISDVGCISRLVRAEELPTTTGQAQSSKGYLGFHEKLQLHHRNQEDAAQARRLEKRAGSKWRRRNSAAAGRPRLQPP